LNYWDVIELLVGLVRVRLRGSEIVVRTTTASELIAAVRVRA
jgi:hypothetical protein